MADIFVSYASEDRERISPLVLLLEQAGLSVWWDRDLKGGAHFPKTIEEELRAAKVVLVAWSSSSLESRWVIDEAELGIQLEKFIPLTFDQVLPPMGFRLVQAVDFSDWDGESKSECVKALLEAVSEFTPAKELPLTSRQRSIEQIDDEPTIAVLPFVNLSSNPEQDYFSDGIVEDLIAAMSRFSWLFVISRNTSSSFKDQKIHSSTIARDLGVRYIVEGSVRATSSRIRVSVQLIDAISDQIIWSEKYDRPQGDLFDLQDDICQHVIGRLVPALEKVERSICCHEQRPDLNAWIAYQKGLEHYYKPFSQEEQAKAYEFFERAIELDPEFADAYAMIALMEVYAVVSGHGSFTETKEQMVAKAARIALKAVQLDETNALAHVAFGKAKDFLGDDVTGISELKTAIKINPNLAVGHYELGFALSTNGQLEESIGFFNNAIRISPNDPMIWNFHLLKGMAQLGLSEFDQALGSFRESLRLRPGAIWPYLGFIGVHMASGDRAKANDALDFILENYPDWTVQRVKAVFEGTTSPHFQKWIDDIKAIGLPEG